MKFFGTLFVINFSMGVVTGIVRQVMPEAKSQIVGLKYFNVYGP